MSEKHKIDIKKISEKALVQIENLLNRYKVRYSIKESELQLLEYPDNLKVYIDHLTSGMLPLYEAGGSAIEGIVTNYNDLAHPNARIVILVLDLSVKSNNYRRYQPKWVE